MENVKEAELITMKEAGQIYLNERQESLDKLYVALDFMKGKCVLADTCDGFNTFQLYNEFDWSLFQPKNGHLKMNLQNDMDYDTETPSIYFKVDDIMDIEIDDNLNYINSPEGVENSEQYYVENIYITLWNDDKLRLELQWA